MELDKRKRKILEVIISNYIFSAKPVSSKTVASSLDFTLSSASVRNVMHQLEESGYIQQPHTSAGRVPTQKGYRFYVNFLMKPSFPSQEEKERIGREFARLLPEGREPLLLLSKVLSKVINYPCITSSQRQGYLRYIRVMRLDKEKVLLFVVTGAEEVAEKIFCAKGEWEKVLRLVKYARSMLEGKKLREAVNILSVIMQQCSIQSRRVFEHIKELLHRVCLSEERVYVEGAHRIMEQPEFADIRKASQFLSMLENKERVRNILLAHIPTKGVRITIGAESVCKWTKNYALITAICKKGKESAGVLGVIGPLRMPYRKIVPMIKYTIDVVSNTWRNHG